MQSIPTGMSVSTFIFSFYWLLLVSVVDYRKRPILILALFNGFVVIFMVISIVLFIYIGRKSFSKPFISEQIKEKIHFTDLKATYMQIYSFSLQLFCIFYYYLFVLSYYQYLLPIDLLTIDYYYYYTYYFVIN